MLTRASAKAPGQDDLFTEDVSLVLPARLAVKGKILGSATRQQATLRVQVFQRCSTNDSFSHLPPGKTKKGLPGITPDTSLPIGIHNGSLSPFISRMWTWCVRRSRSAPVSRSEPKTEVHL